MSIETIVSTLNKLEKMHKSLLELAYKKTELVKIGNMEELDQMLKSEQAHVAAIEQLEQQRQVMVTDYLRTKGIVLTDNPTVADVIEAAEKQEKEQIEIARNRLILVVEDLRKQNDLNQKLVFQSLQFVNITLDMLRPRPEQMNYSGGDVRGTTTVRKKTYFDSQA